MNNDFSEDTLEDVVNNATIQVEAQAKKLGLKYTHKEIFAVCKEAAYRASSMNTIYEKTLKSGLTKLLDGNKEKQNEAE